MKTEDNMICKHLLNHLRLNADGFWCTKCGQSIDNVIHHYSANQLRAQFPNMDFNMQIKQK